MSREEALDAITACRDVPRETIEALDALVDMTVAENSRQNLISASTIENIWSRHILDSAQLAAFAQGRWIDLGSGPGFPGLVIAALTRQKMTLVESRSARVSFLRAAIDTMGLSANVRVFGDRVERMQSETFDAICARAFAPLPRLLSLAYKFSTPETIWVMPKGRSAASELEQIRHSWQGDFRIEASITDPAAGIIVATNVRPGRPR